MNAPTLLYITIMAKRTIKISIKLPTGISASKELEEVATKAANDAVSEALGDFVETQKMAKKLAMEGFQISAEELMRRKVAKPGRKVAAKKKAIRKRVVLSDAQRKKMAADLDAGMKIKEAMKKYGVSSATVMNVKSKAGLTNKQK